MVWCQGKHLIIKRPVQFLLSVQCIIVGRVSREQNVQMASQWSNLTEADQQKPILPFRNWEGFFCCCFVFSFVLVCVEGFQPWENTMCLLPAGGLLQWKQPPNHSQPNMQTFISKQEEVTQPSHASWLSSQASELSQTNSHLDLLAKSCNFLVRLLHSESFRAWSGGEAGEAKQIL